MNKLFYTLISLLGLASCANTYNIQGSSNVSTLDGRMQKVRAGQLLGKPIIDLR